MTWKVLLWQQTREKLENRHHVIDIMIEKQIHERPLTSFLPYCKGPYQIICPHGETLIFSSILCSSSSVTDGQKEVTTTPTHFMVSRAGDVWAGLQIVLILWHTGYAWSSHIAKGTKHTYWASQTDTLPTYAFMLWKVKKLKGCSEYCLYNLFLTTVHKSAGLYTAG